MTQRRAFSEKCLASRMPIDIICMPREEAAFKELDAARKELYASFNQLFNEVK